MRSALRGSLAHELKQFTTRFRPHDRFVGRAQRRQHPRQPLLLLLGARLLVRAIEVTESKRDVVGEPLQQFGEFGGEGVDLGRDKEHHAGALVVDQQRKGRARPCTIALDHLLERCAARIAGEIVAQARLPRPVGGAAYPAALRIGVAAVNL